MEKKLARVKKYKSLLNLIICTIFSLLMGFITFVVLHIDFSDSWFYYDLTFGILIFIMLFLASISVFKKQRKFNKSTPKYYISLTNDNSLEINGKVVDIKDIENISFNKILKWELFGELRVLNDEDYVKPKIKAKYKKMIKKSNLGNIIIESNSSRVVLRRVDDVETTVKEIKNIINK